MSILDVFVASCMVVGIGSAALVAFQPNILYAAISLIFTLLSVAGLYGALGADFLAAAQLMIYVGGIIVVILFAVMMSENIYKTRFLQNASKLVFPSILAVMGLFGLSSLIMQTRWFKVEFVERFPTTKLIGQALVGPYALAFQYVAVVLLAGLIGAVIIARPDHQRNED
jgi:NAD(P)H-quinone oxidoreductase subunit 6